MRRLGPLVAALAVALSVAVTAATAGNGTPINAGSANPLTVAVFGDLPYTQPQIEGFDRLADSVNADPKVDLAIHLGDIKSGGTLCDDATYARVLGTFERFKDPLVYTPGDNEWTDCHRANNGAYKPTERLSKLREVFFPVPGQTLGGRKQQVLTQSSDADYADLVEHTLFMRSKVVFVTVNVPGSNNDLVPWGTPWNTGAAQAEQAAEVAHRTAGVLAWLDEAFDVADENGAAGVVVSLQADMWDATTTISQFGGYTEIVRKLATRTLAFGKPVLMLAGDSHGLKTDTPLANGGAPNAFTAFNQLYGTTTPVPNLTRIVVQGSTSAPSSWVRLTIDPNASTLFGWETVEVSWAP